MKHVIYIIIIIILVILNLYQYNHNNKIVKINTVETRRDTVVIMDTVKFDNPTLIYVKTEPDTLYIESIDSTVTIDKETKIYKDSLYELQLSGIRPNLDYINVYPKTTYITTEKVSYVKDKRRFTHGIQAGIGFGIINKKPDVFIGYGVQINF